MRAQRLGSGDLNEVTGLGLYGVGPPDRLDVCTPCGGPRQQHCRCSPLDCGLERNMNCPWLGEAFPENWNARGGYTGRDRGHQSNPHIRLAWRSESYGTGVDIELEHDWGAAYSAWYAAPMGEPYQFHEGGAATDRPNVEQATWLAIGISSDGYMVGGYTPGYGRPRPTDPVRATLGAEHTPSRAIVGHFAEASITDDLGRIFTNSAASHVGEYELAGYHPDSVRYVGDGARTLGMANNWQVVRPQLTIVDGVSSLRVNLPFTASCRTGELAVCEGEPTNFIVARGKLHATALVAPFPSERSLCTHAPWHAGEHQLPCACQRVCLLCCEGHHGSVTPSSWKGKHAFRFSLRLSIEPRLRPKHDGRYGARY